MKRYFSGTTAQQAPMPRIARQGPVWSLGRIQIAFQKPHCKKLMRAFASTKISNTEMTDEGIDANRFVRNHTKMRRPAVLRYRDWNGSGLWGVSVTAVMGSALHQRNAGVVPVHEQADAKTDGQEHQHDERDGFDGLSGLVQRRVRNRHDVLIADRDRQRGILGQVQVLAGHRRNDDAQRLRQHDALQHKTTPQAERLRRVPLAPGDGLYAATHDL